jgi:hypothetical protein
MTLDDAKASVKACAKFDDVVIPRKEIKRGPSMAAIDCENAKDGQPQMKKQKTKKAEASSSGDAGA